MLRVLMLLEILEFHLEFAYCSMVIHTRLLTDKKNKTAGLEIQEDCYINLKISVQEIIYNSAQLLSHISYYVSKRKEMVSIFMIRSKIFWFGCGLVRVALALCTLRRFLKSKSGKSSNFIYFFKDENAYSAHLLFNDMITHNRLLTEK